MIYKEMFERLPERFRKINTEKMYEILFTDYDSISNTLKDIGDSRDIDNAYGKTLDLIGSNVGALRTDEDDELFRQLIKIQIISNRSKGDISTINEVAQVLLGDDYLGLEENWDKGMYKNELAAITINLSNKFKNIPFKSLNQIKSGGVRLFFKVLFEDNITHLTEISQVAIEGKIPLAGITRMPSRESPVLDARHSTQVSEVGLEGLIPLSGISLMGGIDLI